MKHTLSLLAAAMLLTAPLEMAAAKFGYCTDAVGRSNIFRIGSTETQGMAIKLDAGKLQELKGHSITGLSVIFGSSRTTDGEAHLFITNDMAASPVVSQTVKITGATKWLEYTFDTPYTITGSEGQLFIGYTAEISTKSSLLVADHMTDNRGCCYVYNDGEWVDTYGLGVGNVSLRIDMADAPSLTDLMLKPMALSGYFKSGHAYEFGGELFNFGTEPIKSFDLKISVGDQAPVISSYSDVNLQQAATMKFLLPEYTSDSEGHKSLKVEVVNVNGATDTDMTDNSYEAAIYYYPAKMERNILMEGFTGQTCSNCPAGHSTLEKFLESTDVPTIEVMHHAGYTPDFFTMDSDLDYTYFYGSPSTYAPAIMVNRTHVPTIGVCPVMNVTAANLTTAYELLQTMQPYVSLSLASEYDAATRQAKVNVRAYTHNDLPAPVNIVNVMLVQEGIKGLQLPLGTDYVHNGVFRGVLTGNSWGIMLTDEGQQSGGETEWSTTFTLPETIFSDAYNWDKLNETERQAYSIPAVAEDMRIVAFVAAYDGNDVNGHTVYNAIEVPLGTSYTQTGMAGVNHIIKDNTESIDIRIIDRRVAVNGHCDTLQVYTITGESVNAKAQLTPGIYVVRATSGHTVTVKKVLVK